MPYIIKTGIKLVDDVTKTEIIPPMSLPPRDKLIQWLAGRLVQSYLWLVA